MLPYSNKALQSIVNHYTDWRTINPDTQLDYCKTQSCFASLVEVAASAVDKDGKIHPHQYRQGYEKMRRWAQDLLSHLNVLEQAADFNSLYDTLYGLRHYGISYLTVYDTAHRIGAHKSVMKSPSHVYLHSGARKGAIQLLASKAKRVRSLPKEIFPAAFHQLEVTEIEDILCLYAGKWLSGPDYLESCAILPKPRC